jgi:hypothetical protein
MTKRTSDVLLPSCYPCALARIVSPRPPAHQSAGCRLRYEQDSEIGPLAPQVQTSTSHYCLALETLAMSLQDRRSMRMRATAVVLRSPYAVVKEGTENGAEISLHLEGVLSDVSIVDEPPCPSYSE